MSDFLFFFALCGWPLSPRSLYILPFFLSHPQASNALSSADLHQSFHSDLLNSVQTQTLTHQHPQNTCAGEWPPAVQWWVLLESSLKHLDPVTAWSRKCLSACSFKSSPCHWFNINTTGLTKHSQSWPLKIYIYNIRWHDWNKEIR